MKCPTHPDVELRKEYATGYCTKCAKNYALCMETQYMTSCNLLAGHSGEHDFSRKGNDGYAS